MHEDNSKAYAQLPVKRVGVPTVRPVSLAVTEDDIALDSEAPVYGATVQLSAEVQARGTDFTHVGVEFWDGDPRQGWEFIEGELIPMLLAGETATARVA